MVGPCRLCATGPSWCPAICRRWSAGRAPRPDRPELVSHTVSVLSAVAAGGAPDSEIASSSQAASTHDRRRPRGASLGRSLCARRPPASSASRGGNRLLRRGPRPHLALSASRPAGQMRRRRGKTDTVDAEAAARARSTSAAASADGCSRRSMHRRRQPDRRCVVTAAAPVKDRLRALNTARTVEACAAARHTGDLVRSAAKRALRSLARDRLSLKHRRRTARLRTSHPALLGACGVGAETARRAARGVLRRPVPHPSSGPTAPPAQPRRQPPGQQPPHRWSACASLHAYAARLTAEGKTRREILRCLKRHIAREVYKVIIDPFDVAHGADLRRHRTQRGLTIHHTARALNSKEASSTTATSPNVDKHRSIHRWSSPSLSGR